MNIITANESQKTLPSDELKPMVSPSGVILRVNHLHNLVSIELTKAELQELCQKVEAAR